MEEYVELGQHFLNELVHRQSKLSIEEVIEQYNLIFVWLRGQVVSSDVTS